MVKWEVFTIIRPMTTPQENSATPSPDNQAEKLKQEYIRFVNENLTRSDKRQEELNREMAELQANKSSMDLLSLIVRYNYEDGFYDDYPLIVEDLIRKGKILVK